MSKGIALKNRVVSVLLTVIMLVVLFPATEVGSVEINYDLPWLWPVPGSYKLTGLDYYYSGGLHNAGQCIDIANNGYSGENRLDVVSATSGTVLYIQSKYNETDNRGSGWGNYVIVRSGNVNIVYGHLKTVSCTYGPIKAGDVIGKMGNTGNSTGVHLHLQAYPSSENASSTAIPVFEQYRTNPLYVEKFQFMKGLQKESVAYGSWISNYYTNTSGSYYTYSGGLSLDYDVTHSASSVIVINTAGATVRSEPLKENAYNVDTLKYGTTVDIVGHYSDAYGTTWLLLSEGSDGAAWILADDVGFRDYRFGTELVDADLPDDTYGAFADLTFAGTVVSENEVDSLTVELQKDGETLDRFTQAVGLSEFSVSDYIRDGFTVQELNDGTYTLVLSVKERATYPGVDPAYKEKALTTTTFNINSVLSDHIPPLLEEIYVTALTPTELTLYCVATDNKSMDRVEIVISSADESFSRSYIAEADGSTYRLSVPVSDLKGAGDYIIKATAYDSYHNVHEKIRAVTVPAERTAGEIWVVQDILRVRSGPATSYEHLYTINKIGTKVVVTDIQTGGKYLWGKMADGWCAITYCTYESGYLYQVQFDLNGGSGEAPTPLNKRYGADAKISSEKPTREGYTFLGWAKSSDAKVPDYPAGATYSDDKTVTLFAVWQDSVSPTISTVTKNPSKWTNDEVTITVTASDNAGTVYYSFDGGTSWTSVNTLGVKENKIFPSRSIAVKDAYGNVTYYSEAITVDKIDKLPPDMSGVTASVTAEDGKVTLTATGIVDEQSGLSKYELILSPTRDFTVSDTVTVIPGTPVNMADGTYYWKLKVTDGAGNSTVKEFGRFRVGAPQKLSAPIDLAVTKTTSESVDLTWKAVDDADHYVLMFSLTEDFTGELFTHTTSGVIAVVPGLEAGVTYYCRVIAQASDNVFLDSDASQAIRFVTLNNDNTIHGFVSTTDASVDHNTNTVIWNAPYGADRLDLTVTVEKNATVTYWYDEAMTGVMTDLEAKAIPFTGDSAVVYIQITAENGEDRLYAVTVNRAAAVAATPTVDFSATDEMILVGEEPSDLSVIASSTDGGTLTITWYMSYNGGSYLAVGTGESINPTCDKAGDYTLYAVVTNENLKCQTTTASYTTDVVTITVEKHATTITVLISDFVYNGNTPSPAISGYVGDSTVTYRFFADSSCENEIATPTKAGVYYVVAYAAETDAYLAATSRPVRFEIQKQPSELLPPLTVVQPSLRDRNGYVTVAEDGIEYRVKGTDLWLAAEKGSIPFTAPIELEFRVKETENVSAGPTLSVSILSFDGAEDFLPNGSIGLTVDGDYLLASSGRLTAAQLLSGLEKSDGIHVYHPEGDKLNGTSTYVGTGARLTIEDDAGVYKSLYVIVLGDLDGDGLVTRADAEKILELSNGMASIGSEFDFPAADMNSDGVLTSVDAYLALIVT